MASSLRALAFAVAVVAGFAACGPGAGPTDSVGEGAPLPESPVARARLDDLAARFLVTDRSSPEFRGRGTRSGARPVIGEGVATAFQRDDAGGLRATFAPLANESARRGAVHTATALLPARASGPVEVRADETDVAVAFTLRGAGEAPAEIVAGRVLYRGALEGSDVGSGRGASADVVHRVTAEGTEDFVVFEERPEREELVYDVDVSRTAGLRLVGNSLEFIDGAGAPRLRVAPPYVVDAVGERREAKLAVEGCAVDTDPSGPWGRAPVAPGSALCEVRVRWEGVVYPAVVDPNWVATGSMTTPRRGHTATMLGSGKVLMACGYNGVYLSSAELYDPTTGTFAATGPITMQRLYHTATLLASGKVLVAGGFNGSAFLLTAALYDPVAGMFTATGSMLLAGGRENHTATRLPSGKVLMAGGSGAGSTNTAELYDPAAGTFASTAGVMTTKRESHTATLLGSGKVLVAGGYSGTAVIGSAELYDPTAGTFTATGSIPGVRDAHSATLLGSGKVLVAGGYNATFNQIATAALYDPVAGTFAATGSMAQARGGQTETLLGSGNVLLAGGSDGTSVRYASVELYDPAAGTFTAAASMSTERAIHTATLLGSGKVLVAGGINNLGNTLSSAELYDVCATDAQCGSAFYCDQGGCKPDQGNGLACSAASWCTSGFCVDGVCCDQSCTGTCKACTATLKGSGADGVCGSIKTGTDPQAECTDQGASSCGTTGSCSGASTCALYAPGTACNGTCVGSTKSNYTCDGGGICGLTTTSQCDPYVCAGATCGATCASDAQCTAAAYCAANLTCQPDEANGAACSTASGCVSGFCVDGVCCDQACGGACRACTAALKGAGANGVCGPIGAGTDPESECSDQGAASCGTTGVCNGANACAFYPANTSCSTTCSGSSQQNLTCDGVGTCALTSATPCSPYLCAGSTCGFSCSTDAQCVSSAWCSGSSCAPDQTNGGSCTSPTQCLSGNCVDGVCCDQACGGTCQACTLALKGGGSDGVCGPIATGADPQAECAQQAASSCGTTGVCNGASGCSLYPANTACATTCSGSTQQNSTCDGSGSCVQTSTTPCSPYVCGGNACGTSCTIDAQCVSAAFCAADQTCQSDLPNGAACGAGSQCVSTFCVDGVCCDQACDTLCLACSAAKKGQSNSGECGPVKDGADPDNECNATPASDCKEDGACNGSGACRKHPLGTSCGSTLCSGNSVTGQICNGFGSCVQDATGTDCAPYKCVGSGVGSGCKIPCADISECVIGNYCDAGTCKPLQPNGTACAGGVECQSTFCIDGVCCNSKCDGLCQACSAAAKESGLDGVCGAAKQGTDPHDSCADDGALGCDKDGFCDGMQQCELYAAGTECQPTDCQANKPTSHVCDGAGTCLAQGPDDCAPYKCDAGSCTSTCVDSTDCGPGAYCDAATSQCVQQDPDGTACATADTCKSQFCTDGVCCDVACSGQCQACDLPAALGTCSPVVGAPRGDRPPCAGSTGNDPCTAKACDGATNTIECVGFVASEVSCRPPTCAAGVETQIASCDGSGACPAPKTKACEPYACGDTQCLTSCKSDPDCAPGSMCDEPSGKCVSGASCDGDHSVVSPNGTTTDCAPYRCAGGECLTACTTVDDCVAPTVCDPSGRCVAPAGTAGDAAGDDGGCGCTLPGRGREPSAAWALGLLLLLPARRRRVHRHLRR